MCRILPVGSAEQRKEKKAAADCRISGEPSPSAAALAWISSMAEDSYRPLLVYVAGIFPWIVVDFFRP